MADQLAAQALSLYGNKVCKTPNLNALPQRESPFATITPTTHCVFDAPPAMANTAEIRYDNANEIPSCYRRPASGKARIDLSVGEDAFHRP